MKNIFKSIMAAAVLVTGFASCDEDQNLMIVGPEAATFNIITPTENQAVVLNSVTPDNPGLTISWEDIEYTSPTTVTYTVEIDAHDATNPFQSPVSIATTTANFATVSTSALNSAAISAGLVADAQGALDVRVKASVGAPATMETYSNTVVYLVTPYLPFTPAQDLFLVGDATEYGWNNNNSNAPLFRDPENQDLFHFIGYFGAGNFKVLADRGNWHPQYGSVSNGVLGVSNPDGSNEPGTIAVATAGYYEFTMNIADMTYSFVPYDASSAPTFATIGIIGAATPGGWSNDTDLTNSTFNPHLWKIDNISLLEDVMKFRANNDWAVPGNWGSGANSAAISGQTAENGGDFHGVALAGDYEVWFNDLDGRYIFLAN